jgi:hypothetical protein
MVTVLFPALYILGTGLMAAKQQPKHVAVFLIRRQHNGDDSH